MSDLEGLVEELIDLVEERGDLYTRIEVVEDRIKELRTRIGAGAAAPSKEDPPGPPKARSPSRSRAESSNPNGQRNHRLQTAMRWVTDKLRSGPRPWMELLDEALKNEIGSRSTMVRARRELGLCHGRKRYQGPVWVWTPGTKTEMKDESTSRASSPATTASSNTAQS